MIPTQIYIEAFKVIAPFRVKFKSNSLSQKILGLLVRWYLPTYLTHYTTVIGRSIYIPDESLINHPSTRFTIAHEVVHLLDQKRMTTPIFLLLYLSPQVFALGALSFPWLGYHALWFLLFALPWPSPGRIYLEARAYGLELSLYRRSGYKVDRSRFVDIFLSPGYYYMSWSRSYAEHQLNIHYDSALCGSDHIFDKIIKTFDSCEENGAIR